MTRKMANMITAEAAKADVEWTDRIAKLDKLAVAPKVLGPALRKLADVDPRAARVLHRALRDANDAVVIPFAEARTPEQKLTAMAKVWAVKDDISFEKAYDEIMRSETGRALYRQYREVTK